MVLLIPLGSRVNAARCVHSPGSIVQYFKQRFSRRFRENPSSILSKPN
ncbi:hypothetical protein A8H35_12825 [Burkholderia thailandensis]|nr:hypothetical protein A8H35_12825 [Burkholderia thailandensis]AWY66669.1 hypothetical protein A8H36_15610 [Burkholderia thailandensis]PHH37626.1 hypothetical protein CRX59_13970 [Burkholderia thailandensis]